MNNELTNVFIYYICNQPAVPIVTSPTYLYFIYAIAAINHYL